MITPKRYQGTVVSNTKESSKVYVTKFRVNNSLWQYEPGQYVSFILAPTIRRSLSIASPPASPALLRGRPELQRGEPNGNEFEICADVTPMGPGSVWLTNLKVGDNVEFLGPLGRFVVDSQSNKAKIFIATGTGIGPVRSMILDQLNHSEHSNENTVSLYWGLRFEQDVFWHKEFQSLEHTHLEFHYTLTLSKPSHDWQGVDGRVTDHIYEQDKPLNQYDFYLCGSREMVHDVTKHLIEKNVPETQIKTELFY